MGIVYTQYLRLLINTLQVWVPVAFYVYNCHAVGATAALHYSLCMHNGTMDDIVIMTACTI